MAKPGLDQERSAVRQQFQAAGRIALGLARMVAETTVLVFVLSFCIGAPLLSAVVVAGIMVLGSELLVPETGPRWRVR